jgi:cysteine desulfuration protein SufE
MKKSIDKKILEWSGLMNQLAGMEKLEYIIELGRRLTPLKKEYKLESFRIHGCASNLWVAPEYLKDSLKLHADADAFVTKGTAYIVLDILNEQSYADIKKITLEDFQSLGIREILTPQRQNGLGSLILTIKNYANRR